MLLVLLCFDSSAFVLPLFVFRPFYFCRQPARALP
jgi:hypothetical protein